MLSIWKFIDKSSRVNSDNIGFKRNMVSDDDSQQHCVIWKDLGKEIWMQVAQIRSNDIVVNHHRADQVQAAVECV